MNLNKLFNFKYLKQNLKKSRGQLILFLSIVPVFTFLILMMALKDSSGEVLEIFEISIINILGMYVIPIILSINLFGYVYKRKSVDFINSMPINRKIIFLTNTLGGIILITLMQLINMLGIFLVGKIYPNVIIFSSMILDVFVMMTISYIFVFVSANIAMAVSGNKLTQIVVTLLILFLVPFTASSIMQSFYNIKLDYNLIDNDNVIGYVTVKDNLNDTTPYRIIRMVLTDSMELFFNVKSLVKTLLLSIVYIFVGCFIFKNRKFENTEESFQKVIVHSIVKALTIFPMIMLLAEIDYLDNGIEIILFCLAFICAYYFIYDIITAKKVKIVSSIINLVITLIVLNGVCYGMISLRDNLIANINIDKEDIAGISINIGKQNDGGYSTSEIMNYYMENDELIEYIYSYEEEENYRYFIRHSEYPVRIKLKNGKIYNTFLVIRTNQVSEEDNMEKLIEILSKDEEYVRLYKKQYTEEGKFLLENYNLSEEENEYFSEKINRYINSASLKNIWENNYSNNRIYLKKYDYTNHRLVKTTIKSNFDTEVFNKIIEISNKNSKNILEQKKDENEDNSFYITSSSENRGISKDFYKDEDIKIIEKVILEEYDKLIDINSEYYIVNSYGSNKKITFYTQNENIRLLYNQKQEEYYYDKYIDDNIESATVEIVENVNEVNLVTNTLTNNVENVANIVD